MIPRIPALLRLGLARGSRWRVLAIFAGLALLPSLVAALPIWRFLAGALDHVPGLEAGGAGMRELLEVAKALTEEGAAAPLGVGLAAAAATALLVGPWSAGAALAEARAEAPLRTRALLGAAGELYGRLLRTLLVAVIPLGVAAGIAGALQKAGEHWRHEAPTEAEAVTIGRITLAVALAVVFLAQLTLDAGRAQLGARRERRSALLAWAAGVWLVVRRPLRTLAVGATGTLLGLGVAFGLLAIRGRLPGQLALGFVLATLATAAVAWGRSIRLAGLAELAAADQAVRRERKARRRAEKAARSAAKEAARRPVEPVPALAPAAGAPAAADAAAPLAAQDAPPPGDPATVVLGSAAPEAAAPEPKASGGE